VRCISVISDSIHESLSILRRDPNLMSEPRKLKCQQPDSRVSPTGADSKGATFPAVLCWSILILCRSALHQDRRRGASRPFLVRQVLATRANSVDPKTHLNLLWCSVPTHISQTPKDVAGQFPSSKRNVRMERFPKVTGTGIFQSRTSTQPQIFPPNSGDISRAEP
jgi:hypothetical protein